MHDTDPPKDQLIAELAALRQRVVELETAQAAHAQTADALQANERRYRHWMEHSLGLLCIHDLDGILLEVNTAAARALGYHPRDGVGKSLRAFIAPAVQHQFDAYLERIRHQSSDSGLLRVVTRTGEERVWLYRNIRYEEPDHPPYVLGHALDITERVQMEQALKQAHETLERRVAARTAALHQVNAQLQVEITERKRAEEQLRFQAQLLDSVQESVVATDLEGRVTYWGKGAEALYGYRAEEMLGRPITCIVGSPDEKAEEPQRMRTVYETGAWQGQYVQQRKDGSAFWADTVIALVTDAHDQPCGFVGIDRDITERQRAEAALRSSEIRKTAVLDAALDCIITIDRAGKVVEWNPAAETTFGFSREQVLGHPLAELIIPPDFRAAHDRGLAQYLATGAGAVLGKRVEFTALRADGTPFPAEISIVPIPLPDALLFTGYLRDITECKQVEDRFRLVVEAAPSALLMVDEHGVMTLANSQTEQLFGYSRAELLGQPVEMLVPERFRAVHPRHREGFFQAPTTRAMGAGRDLFGLCKDGREVPIEIGLNPLRTEEGPLVLASIIDITERVQAAQRLMNSLREKEVLLREIHHRVKNNLSVINSLLYLQSSTTQDEQTLRMLQNCRDRVYSMALVHERLYRSEDLASVDFAEYIEELTSQLFRNHVLSADTIQLKLEAEKSPLDIDRAIPCGLILNELISNALKHAFPNGRSGEIRVSLQRTKDGGLILSVTDNGVGLPDEATLQTRRSLGMRLVHSLATQLDTQIEFLRRDPGTEVRWRLETSHV